MKKLLYFSCIIILMVLSSLGIYGCDAAEDYGEEMINIPDTTVTIIDTIKSKTEINFVPVKFDLVVQLSSFSKKENAEKYSVKTDSILSKSTSIINIDGHFLVTIGKFTDPERANAYLEYIRGKGYPEAFVKKVKKTE